MVQSLENVRKYSIILKNINKILNLPYHIFLKNIQLQYSQNIVNGNKRYTRFVNHIRFFTKSIFMKHMSRLKYFTAACLLDGLTTQEQSGKKTIETSTLSNHCKTLLLLLHNFDKISYIITYKVMTMLMVLLVMMVMTHGNLRGSLPPDAAEQGALSAY